MSCSPFVPEHSLWQAPCLMQTTVLVAKHGNIEKTLPSTVTTQDSAGWQVTTEPSPVSLPGQLPNKSF